MIKVEELRLGNWVRYKKYREEGAVAIRATDFFNYEEGEFKLYPITITEEILFIAGFTKNKMNYWSHDELSDFESEFLFNSKSHVIRGVHQLQNFFYAITQKELQINLHNQK